VASPWSLRRVVTAGVIGNVLEWYDFAVYGFVAPILARQFFPSDDPRGSLLATFGAFAVGFLMRPVGAALFGHIGDRYGRARALLWSVGLMAVPTVLMGLLPTYAMVGITASFAMVALRMCQGIAVGGEFTSSIVFLAEHAPPNRRGFFGSFAVFGATAGTMLGSAVGALLTNVLSAESLEA
jgi:MHS family proline/betaine transporter-like MFS transporter